MMKKDYVLIAAALRLEMWNQQTGEIRDMAQIIAGHVTQALKRDNPRFDESRFRKACGL